METSSVQDQIKISLTRDFEPVFIEVTDDSARHRGHREASAGSSHFSVKLAAQAFNGMSLIKRHQAVYRTLDRFFKSGVHALQMEILSAEEWHARRPG